MRIKSLIVLISLGFLAGAANASTVTLSGYFDDPANPALFGSDLGAPLFGNDDEIAKNVALYGLLVLGDGDVTFTSKGYTTGGAEPYFSLFEGSDRDAAMFFDSNYFIFDIDFELTRYMTVGSYWIAIGVWENMSFAENLGSRTLDDGFTRLGDPTRLGNYYYELEVTGNVQAVPEPGTFWLIVTGLAGLIGARKRFV
jgi:hypothetical protein